MMPDKHQHLMAQLITAVYQSKGVTRRALRTAIGSAFAPGINQLETGDGSIPVALKPYLNKVGCYAHRVTDGDIETLKSLGYSEEAIFELTVSAAVGAGLGRLQQGLAALNSQQTSPSGGG